MKVYRLVICYNEKTEQMEYLEESIEEDVREPIIVGTVDISEYFEEFIDYYAGEIAKA